MTTNTTIVDSALLLTGEGWCEVIEAGAGDQVWCSIEAILEEELTTARRPYILLNVHQHSGVDVARSVWWCIGQLFDVVQKVASLCRGDTLPPRARLSLGAISAASPKML